MSVILSDDDDNGCNDPPTLPDLGYAWLVIVVVIVCAYTWAC